MVYTVCTYMYSMELGGFDVVNQCISPVGEKESYRCSELPVKEESGQYYSNRLCVPTQYPVVFRIPHPRTEYGEQNRGRIFLPPLGMFVSPGLALIPDCT
jgi:hypothetical protein